MTETEIIRNIKKVIKKVRPYLNNDGGDLEFVRFENGILYVRLLGACVGCGSINDTMKNGIEAMMLEEVPGVIGVEQVTDEEE